MLIGKAFESTDKDKIEEYIERRVQLLFGYSLFSYLDKISDANGLIEKVLTCGKSPEEWLKTPKHLLLYLGSVRVAYVLSLMCHLSHPRFRDIGVSSSFKDRLTSIIKQKLEFFQNKLTDAFIETNDDLKGFKKAKLLRNKLTTNLHFLLTELGEHDFRSKVEVLRNLHKSLIYEKAGHSPTLSGLDDLDSKLVLLANKIKPLLSNSEMNDYTFSISQTQISKLFENVYSKEKQNIKISRDEKIIKLVEKVKNACERALYSVSILDLISNDIKRFFTYVQVTGREQKNM